MDLVQQIHNEVDVAVIDHIEKSKEVLSLKEFLWDVDDRAETLLNLGFSSLKEVKQYSKKKELFGISSSQTKSLKSKAKEVAEFIQSMSIYPYKLISYSKMMQICEKYGLYLGDTKRFKGTVPDKNVQDMAGYKCPKVKKTRMSGITEEESLAYHNNGLFNYPGYTMYRYEDFNPLYIVAPLNDFDLKDASIIGNEIINYSYKDVVAPVKIKVQDPIVLQPLAGPVLFFHVITKWGAEADIQEIQNPIDN